LTRVVVPHTAALRTETVAALRAQAASLELVDVSHSEVSYWELLTQVWQPFEDLVLVEQDVVVPEGALAALSACPSPWCSLPEERKRKRPGSPDSWRAGYLQANRFRPDAMAAHPQLFAGMAPWCRHWLALDSASLPRLERLIGPPHVHWGYHTRHLVEGEPLEHGRGGYWDTVGHEPKRDSRVTPYLRWLAQFAPSPAELPGVLARLEVARAYGTDDLEALRYQVRAAYAKRALGLSPGELAGLRWYDIEGADVEFEFLPGPPVLDNAAS
jgi:hypothetical protein